MKRAVLFLALVSWLFGQAPASAHGGRAHYYRGELYPPLCPQIYDPVHGRDGNVYANVCIAAQAGVRLTWEGDHTN